MNSDGLDNDTTSAMMTRPPGSESGSAEVGSTAEETRDPRSDLHPAANVKKVIWAGMATVVLVFGGFGTWAAVAPLAGAVIGQGQVKVDTNRKTVQHLEGGIVQDILVREGDHVEASQTLIIIADERVDAIVEVLKAQLDAELAKAARLEAQRDQFDQIRFPEELTSRRDEPKVVEFMLTEETYFHTKRGALLEEIALLEGQMQETRQEIEGLQSQVEASEAAAKLLNEEIAANQSLERSQYVQKTHILSLKRALQDYNFRRGEAVAGIARARQRIADLRLRIVQVRDDYVQRAVEDLTGVHATGVYARIFDLKQRLRPSQDAKRRQHVKAPISGTVVGMNVFTVGGVIRPGEALMDIVPDDNPLIVEARIGVDDIDDVHPGQETDIRFSAYKQRSTPLVAGTVTHVSADRLVDEDTGSAFYRVHVNVDRLSLEDANIKMYPGMPAEVYIKTGERTALDYLLAPVTQTLRRSFRES